MFIHAFLLLQSVVTSGRHGSLSGQRYIQRVRAIIWYVWYDTYAQVGTQDAGSPNKIQITYQHHDKDKTLQRSKKLSFQSVLLLPPHHLSLSSLKIYLTGLCLAEVLGGRNGKTIASALFATNVWKCLPAGKKQKFTTFSSAPEIITEE